MPMLFTCSSDTIYFTVSYLIQNFLNCLCFLSLSALFITSCFYSSFSFAPVLPLNFSFWINKIVYILQCKTLSWDPFPVPQFEPLVWSTLVSGVPSLNSFFSLLLSSVKLWIPGAGGHISCNCVIGTCWLLVTNTKGSKSICCINKFNPVDWFLISKPFRNNTN